MRKNETKLMVLFVLFILSLQIAGFLLLNSALKSVPGSMTGLSAGNALMGKIITPYYHLHLVLILITLSVSVSGCMGYLKRRLIQLSQTNWFAKPKRRTANVMAIKTDQNPDSVDSTHIFAVMRSVIARHENEIRRLAYWDSLTGLPNRVQFISMLNQAIMNAAQSTDGAAGAPENACFVLMMDLDRFKNVNDVMGHSFGDQLLKQVAARLSGSLPGAQLARMGGDEFSVLLCSASLKSACDAAQTLLLLLENPITIDDQTVDLGAGIGIAGYPEHGDNAEVLLSHAELAMYAAKRNLGSNFVVYRPEIDHGSQQNLSLIGELRQAILHGQLCLYVQPKFGLKEKKVVGVEALIRWNHPSRGFLAPDQFIVFAEQTGIIRQLTRWIIEQAALLSKTFFEKGLDLKISINVSTHDLLDPELPRKVAEILARHRVQNSSIGLEITESAIMKDPQRAQITLEKLSAMGVQLSIDDFGTGYSSLAYLKRLPVNELKIDQSFVVQMAREDDDRTIVKSTIDLGHNMGMRVVAEGVESPVVMRLLARMDCDQAQGNYIKEPIPVGQFLAWLARQA